MKRNRLLCLVVFFCLLGVFRFRLSARQLAAITPNAMLATVYLTKRQRVTLVDLQYPYGKKKVYMSGSLVSIAAQCKAAGHEVEVLDFNIDDQDGPHAKETLSRADVIGVSVVGSPYFPQTIKFCEYVAKNYPNAKLLLGGQVIRGLKPEEFIRIFGTHAIQIAEDDDAAPFFGTMSSAFHVPFRPVWEQMGDERLRQYLSHEFSLVLSQGCAYNCKFCGARKNEKEQHKQLDLFQQDMLFLANKAKAYGLPQLECYASALDFFQNPSTVAEYMRSLADVSSETGIKMKVRALSCMNTFLKASRTVPDFAELVRDSGLWCIGFGVDGPNREVWKQQNKLQNSAQDIIDCLNLSEKLGIRAEVLMIMGYPNNTPRQMWETVKDCYRYTRRWPNTVLRPYLAKTVLPGNSGWEDQESTVGELVASPYQFYNLDICALGSPITHPGTAQRWLANLSYLSVICGLAPIGRCATSPLVPQGSNGPIGLLAKLINRHMPFDR